MALERLSKEKLGTLLDVEKVDSGNGELFGRANKQDPSQRRLMLIVSTGGSGMTSIRQAVRLAGERLKPEYAKYAKFIMIDSDSNALDSFQHHTNVIPLNISTPGAGVRLQPENRTTFQKRFIPADFNAGELNSDGAGQKRLIGKIKLYDADRSGSSYNDLALEKIVRDLFEGDWQPMKDSEIDLIVLSGLSGGNGSGTFIDIPVHVKKSCPNPSRVRTFGFLMLPDTADEFAPSLIAKRSLRANGYAALKELEAYMSIRMEKDRKELFYSSDGTSYTIDNVDSLYNYPILLSGNYRKVTEMIGETLVNMMASNVDPDKAKDPSKAAESAFDMFSFFSNIDQAKNNVFNSMGSSGRLKENECPEDSHSYCGIGFSTASIPEKVVIPNALAKVSARLYRTDEVQATAAAAESAAAWVRSDAYLSKRDFNNAIRQLLALNDAQATRESLWNEKILPLILDQIHFEENPYEVSIDDLVDGSFEDFLGGYRVKDVTAKGADAVAAGIRGLYKSLYVQARNLVEKYGPRVIEYLYNGNGGEDETGQIITYDSSLSSQMKFAAEKLLAMSQHPGRKPDKIPPLTFGEKLIAKITKTKVDTWIAEADNWASDSVQAGIAAYLVGTSNDFEKEYRSKVIDLQDRCIRFADILEQMQTFYEGAGATLDAADFQLFSQKAGEANNINLCDDLDTYKWIKSSVDAKVRSVDLNKLRAELTNSFFTSEGMAIWTSDKPGEARDYYDSIFSKVCQIGAHATAGTQLSLSIEDYFAEKLKDAKSPSEEQKIINTETEDIMKKLLTASKPSLRMREDSGKPVINVTVMLPSTLYIAPHGQQIFAAFRSKVQAIFGTGINNVLDSSAVDQIVCYQTSVANALCNLADIDMWEDAYNLDRSDTIHLNDGEFENRYTEEDLLTRQKLKKFPADVTITAEDNLLATTGLSWRHYPAINTRLYGSEFASFEKFAAAGHEDTAKGYEARYRRDVFSKKIEYALREKLIELKRNGNKYCYVLNLIPDDWTNLSLEGAPADVEKGSTLFQYLSSQNPGSHSQWPNSQVPIALDGTPFFGRDGFDSSTLLRDEPGSWTEESLDRLYRSYMMRIMRKNVYLYRALEDTIQRYLPVRMALDERASREKYAKAAVKFAEYYVFGIITADPKNEIWKATVTPVGGNVTMLKLDFVKKMSLSPAERELVKENLSAILGVRAYEEMREAGTVRDEALDRIKDRILAKAPDDFQEQVEKHAAELQQLLERFSAFTEYDDEPEEKLMEKLKLDPKPDNISFVDMISQIMRGLKEGIENLLL